MIAGLSFHFTEGSSGAALSKIPATVRVPSRQAVGSGSDEVVAVSVVSDSVIHELCKARPEFELIGQLGEGAFGRVYLARQHALGGRLVALKVSSEEVGEAQLLARLLHTNIVPVYSTHRLGYYHAVCMPYLGATTLADLIRDFRKSGLPESGRHLVSTLQSNRNTRQSDPPTGKGSGARILAKDPWPGEAVPLLQPSTQATLDRFAEMSYTESVVWIGQQLADGLAHAHERGIVHRDLKPANVLLTDDGTPMLLDFNLAQDVEAEHARVGGTLPYMAPEALRRILGEPGGPRECGPRSDLYSLGLILFELLTGRLHGPLCLGTMHEYTRQLSAVRAAPAPSLRDLNPAVTPALESIVRHCLEPDPADRYQSAHELQEDLKRQRENRPLRFARDPSLLERGRKWVRRYPRLAALSVTLLLASLVTAALAAATVGYRGWALRLDAERSLEQLAEQTVEAHFCLTGQSSDEADAAARRAREALAPYQALDDPRWRERSKASYLPAEKRERLEATVAALLLVQARGEAAQAMSAPAGEERQRRLRAAMQLNAKAAQNGGERHLPRAVLAQKADFLKLQGAEEEARACRIRAENEPPRGPSDAHMTGRELMLAGQHQQALAFLQDATRQAPEDAAAWFLLARCQEALGRDRDAVASYTVVLGLRPRTAVCYFQRGLAYFRRNDNPQALEDFTRAIELGQSTADAHINRALTLHRLGRLKESIEEIDRAVALSAPYTRVYFIRARLREQSGDRDGARRDREEGLKREPTDELSWVARGVARLDDDARGALADFEKAIDLNPRSLPGLVNAAHVQSERLRQPNEALALLDRAVAAHPEHLPTRANRGLILARLGRRGEALEEAKVVLRGTPEPAVLFQVGALYAQTSGTETKDREEALRLLKLALRRGHGHDRIGHSPDLEPLRKTDEFKRLLSAAQGLN